MKILRLPFISRGLVRANPMVMFVFGDNDIRKGMGGQAKEMRGELNALGIRVKNLPARTPDSYWTDREYSLNEAKIDEDFLPVERHLALGGIVAIPADGIGTGLGAMGIRCPKTYLYLTKRLETLIAAYGQTTDPVKAGLKGDWK